MTSEDQTRHNIAIRFFLVFFQARPGIYVATIIALIAVFQFATIRGGHTWGDDFAQYILHARNIAHGAPYADTGYIRNPYYIEIGPVTYPPLTPLLLTPLYLLFGSTLYPMKGEMTLFLVLSLIPVYFIFRSRCTALQAGLILLLVGLNPYLWEFKNYIGSDLLFLFLCYLTLFIFERLHKEDRPFTPWLAMATLAGIFAYSAYATRSVGLVLVIAFLLSDLIRFRRISSSTALLATVAGSLIVLQNLLLRSEASYVQEITTHFSPRVPVENAWIYFKELSGIFSNGYSIVLGQALYLLTVPVVLIGFWRSVRTGITVLEVCLVVYLCAIFLFPSNQGIRYLVPIVPAYFYYLIVETRSLSLPKMAKAAKYFAVIVTGFVFLSYGFAYSRKDFGPETTGICEPDFQELCGFIRQNTDTKDKFVFRKPRALTLLTGRAAAAYNSESQISRMQEFLHDRGIRYIIVADLPDNDFVTDRTILSLFVRQNASSLDLVYSNSHFKLYRLH